MSRTTLAALAVLALSTIPALAAHCPADAAAITAALEKVSVSGEIEAQIVALRDEGMALHEAGNHRESEAKLAEAMRLLLNSI